LTAYLQNPKVLMRFLSVRKKDNLGRGGLALVLATPLPATGPQPTVDALINRYVTGLGGADALAKVEGRLVKGTFANLGHID